MRQNYMTMICIIYRRGAISKETISGSYQCHIEWDLQRWFTICEDETIGTSTARQTWTSWYRRMWCPVTPANSLVYNKHWDQKYWLSSPTTCTSADQGRQLLSHTPSRSGRVYDGILLCTLLQCVRGWAGQWEQCHTPCTWLDEWSVPE